MKSHVLRNKRKIQNFGIQARYSQVSESVTEIAPNGKPMPPEEKSLDDK